MQVSLGATAIMSIMLHDSVSPIVSPELEDGSINPDYTSACVAVVFISGLFQLGMGIVRFGFLGSFVSHAVVSGFTSAGAVLIVLSQLRHILGYKLDAHGIHQYVINILQRSNQFNYVAFLIALTSMFVLFVFKKQFFLGKAIIKRNSWIRRLPSQLFVVVISTLVVYATRLNETSNVDILGPVPSGLPEGFSSVEIISQGISGNTNSIVMAAATIALVGYVECIAIGKAFGSNREERISSNQELISLGVVNTLGGMLQCPPASAGFGRTAVHVSAGAQTPLASLISSFVILVCLLLLTSLFYYLPKASLGAIVIMAVATLVDVHEPFHLWKIDKLDFCTHTATIFATLFLGVEMGIIVGVAISICCVLYRSAFPHVGHLGVLIMSTDEMKYTPICQIPICNDNQIIINQEFPLEPSPFFGDNSSCFVDLRLFRQAMPVQGVFIFRYEADIFFANVEHFEKKFLDELALAELGGGYDMLRSPPPSHVVQRAIARLAQLRSSTDQLAIVRRISSRLDSHHLAENAPPPIFAVVFDFSVISSVDSSGMRVFLDILKKLKTVKKLWVFIGAAHVRVKEKFFRYGVSDLIGPDTFHWTVNSAVQHALSCERMAETNNSHEKCEVGCINKYVATQPEVSCIKNYEVTPHDLNQEGPDQGVHMQNNVGNDEKTLIDSGIEDNV
eukprot:GHVR01145435.1.p1 GENE.GHVR01145435.1~~GHVR01145435.1.p1  ORF type:complete len:677 (+),score=80.12 GHVR01145435.1:440-2470(+)